MPDLKPKVSVIGAGNVGTRFAYALMIKGLARTIVLVDVNRKRAEGETMDLSHGVPYAPTVDIVAGDYPDIRDSDLVVFTAGRNQVPGQTRMDLARSNVDLLKGIVPEVMKHAPSAIFLVVSNPVDVLSYAAWRISGKPSTEVLGSGTVLDTARFRSQIARHCSIDPRSIHAYILGEHGDSEFPVWSRAMIGGVLFDDFCPFCRRRSACDTDKVRRNIFSEVRDSAYRIIERKGETSYGIGLALTAITRAVLQDANTIMPVSQLAEEYLGISDVYLSLPAVVGARGVREVLPIKFNDGEMKALRHSAETIRNVIREAGL